MLLSGMFLMLKPTRTCKKLLSMFGCASYSMLRSSTPCGTEGKYTAPAGCSICKDMDTVSTKQRHKGIAQTAGSCTQVLTLCTDALEAFSFAVAGTALLTQEYHGQAWRCCRFWYARLKGSLMRP